MTTTINRPIERLPIPEGLAPEALAAILADPHLFPGSAPMAAEVAETHLDRITDLLSELDFAVKALRLASCGGNDKGDTDSRARFLPDGTIKPLVDWAGRIAEMLGETYEKSKRTDRYNIHVPQ